MRTFDGVLGSQPCPESFRMLARSARMRLDTDWIRIKTLETHADHKERKDTPYISFTNCPQGLEELANFRRTRRARSFQRIVVIDPRVRIKLGLPILHCGTEMSHYQAKVPYGKDYWQNQYLCLWEITPAEVVGVWVWDHLRRSPDWYRNIIMPAVNKLRQHAENRTHIQRNICQKIPKLSPKVDKLDEDSHWSGSDDDPTSEVDHELGSEHGSDDSYDRVCEENLSGQLLNMWEELRFE